MLSHEGGSKDARPTKLGGSFTPDELERLNTLARDFRGHAEHSEWMMDPMHLEFARWLVEHGRLSDGMEDEADQTS
jgi:uncharacterized protein YcbK (DUF882 family)